MNDGPESWIVLKLYFIKPYGAVETFIILLFMTLHHGDYSDNIALSHCT